MNKSITQKDMNQYKKAYTKAVRNGNFKDLNKTVKYLTTKYVGMIDITTGEILN